MDQPDEMSRTWAQRVVAGGPERRLLLALLSASVAAWVALWLILHLVFGMDRVNRGGPAYNVEELGASFFLVLFWPVIAAPRLVLGSIVHGTLAWFRIRRWPAYGLAGCLAGFLIGSALLVPGFSF